jgi:hypothetical protein
MNIFLAQLQYPYRFMLKKKKKNFSISTVVLYPMNGLGIIKPIYKNKGDSNQPENYRPISLLSCLGKLFTSILRKRLED